jgi:RNA ligase (TIGR02306 family)
METKEPTDTPIVRDTSPLASVQRVHSPRPIPGRDIIVVATVQGYTVVVKKTEFFVQGDESLCVFFQPDALLDPANDEFKFLDSKRGRLITTKKMFGVYSQGLCCQLDMVAKYGLDPTTLVEGQDITLALNTSKYVTPEELTTQYQPKTIHLPFPGQQVPKTDELNLQTYISFLEQIKGRRITITLKMDGSSMTVTSDGKLCGRNFEWAQRDASNEAYYRAAEKYQIFDKLRNAGYECAIQGELVGPKIQINPAGLKEVDWMVFNVFKDHQYLPQTEVNRLCSQWGFKTVPCLYEDVDVDSLPLKTMEDWLTLADRQTYANGKPAEGIVVKTVDYPRMSFKVISRLYASK